MVRKKSSTSADPTAPKSSKGSTNGRKKKGSPTSSGEPPAPLLTDPEREILEHIGRYRISVRPVLTSLFFGGDKIRTQDAIARLRDRGWIANVKGGLPGGYSYYQLTAKGCTEAAFPLDRSRPLAATGLSKALAVLWFATMNGKRRARLKEDAPPAGFPPTSGRAPHVGEAIGEGRARIVRIHIASETSDHASPLKEIREAVEAMRATPEGREVIESGAYCFAILVHNEEKKERFTEAIKAYQQRHPLGAVIDVETAPTPGTFPLFVNRAH